MSITKNIHALSQYQFNGTMRSKGITDDNVHEYMGNAFIQIMGEYDSKHPDCALHFKKDHPNVLTLLFDDVDEEMEIGTMGGTMKGQMVVPMSEEQGKQILRFVEANKHKNTFLVHCHAGISRSGAVAKFLCEHFGMEDKDYYTMNPHTHPNQRIINILRRLHQNPESWAFTV